MLKIVRKKCSLSEKFRCTNVVEKKRKRLCAHAKTDQILYSVFHPRSDHLQNYRIFFGWLVFIYSPDSSKNIADIMYTARATTSVGPSLKTIL